MIELIPYIIIAIIFIKAGMSFGRILESIDDNGAILAEQQLLAIRAGMNCSPMMQGGLRGDTWRKQREYAHIKQPLLLIEYKEGP